MRRPAIPAVGRAPGFVPIRILYRHLAERFGRGARNLRPECDRPRLLMLETSARCNLSCPKCAFRFSHRPRGLMDVDLALAALDQAREWGLPMVALSQGGEPLLHPELETIIAAARSRGLAAYFVTNGTLLTPERSRRLIDSGLDALNVSFDGWDEESYSARQTGGRMKDVLENLRRFREARGSSPQTRLSSVTILDSQSLPHVARIREILSPLVDVCEFRPLIDFGFPGRRLDRDLLLGVGTRWRMPCSQLWNNLVVGWDGRVTACCNDQDCNLAYADFRRQSLREIWSSTTLREWRRLHLAGRFSAMPLCGDCTIDYQKSLAYAWLRYRLGRG